MYDLKVKKYADWDHGGHIIPLAFDSVHVKREWNSEAERIRLKKFFIDSLSVTIAKQRVREIKSVDHVILFIMLL